MRDSGQRVNHTGKVSSYSEPTYCNTYAYILICYCHVHNIGVRIYLNGNIYEGQFINGKIEGTGKMIYANGDKYVGEWRDGFYSGQGLMAYVTGDSYEGQFRQGLYCNEGMYYVSCTHTISYITHYTNLVLPKSYVYAYCYCIYKRCI